MSLKGIELLRRIRGLARLMPMGDACSLAFGGNRPGDIVIRLLPKRRRITLRGATTDLACFHKVFIRHEYEADFEYTPKVIVDAGANVGMATLYFAERYPKARILAIEPARENFEILRRNCGEMENVTLLQAALWPVRGQVSISNQSKQEWGYSVSEQSNESDAYKIPAVTVADALDILRTDRIDLLKLDIEGSELELFSAQERSWIEHVNYIAIELHDFLRPGCAKAFYSALITRDFTQKINGENVFVALRGSGS